MLLNPPEVNYRAARDMGLAAWFGMSLANAVTLNAAVDALEDERERIRVLDTAMRKATPVFGAAISSYLIGTQLVREQGDIFDESGAPKILRTGVESPFRAALAGMATAAGVTARLLRGRIKANEEARSEGRPVSSGSENLKGALRALQWLVAGLTGWLLFLVIKEDVRSHH